MAISASSGVRRRLGRTLRRTRGANGGTTTAPLQAIEENTVIDLTQPGSSTSSHFDKSPAPVKPKRSEAVKPEKQEKKEKQEKQEPVVEKEKEEKTTGAKRRREQSLAVAEKDDKPSKSSRSTRGGAKASTKSQKTSGKASASARASVGASAAAELDRKTQRAAQLLEELEKQLEKRCSELLAEAERKSEELRMELKVQLMFLPESVRAMPWKTFIEDFGGSLENVIQGVKDQDYLTYVSSQQGMASPHSALKIRPVPSTVRSKDRRSHGNTPGQTAQASTTASLASGLLTPSASIRASISNYQTPLMTPSSNIPSTVIRTARKGEMTYSIRGSPIAPGSITKAPAGSLVATFQQDEVEPLACITLDNETALDLTNPELLNDETRAHARAKLEALQAKVNALLRQFK